MPIHKGGCHCGAVTFQVKAEENIKASRCNCSICNSTGFIHLIVENKDFELITGHDDITTYSFNTHTAKHTFCKHCGIKSFYTPRSHPDGISVNINCLDQSTIKSIDIFDFDGTNWEKDVDNLKKNLS